MGRSNNAALACRISADEQLYKDSTDKGSQQETVVAAPKNDTRSLLLSSANCFPAQLSPGRWKTLAAGYRNLTFSVNLALPPAKSQRCSRRTKSANCRERLEQTSGKEQRDPPSSFTCKLPQRALDYGWTQLQIKRRVEKWS
ncbi:hypothetical protein DUI87_14251 [Hirundo rustica rustica]|uniref:Uncharacterized protein n=1 Tax=Hirundo rustica rustica TaxID=333673 RepID=A0A3M0K7S5_HIRRU|nr:hypothetical protein DUI87_14251 [Hirundo rustica rustica]